MDTPLWVTILVGSFIPISAVASVWITAAYTRRDTMLTAAHQLAEKLISQADERISRLADQLAAAEQRITELTSQIATLTHTISELRADYEAAVAERDELRAQITTTT